MQHNFDSFLLVLKRLNIKFDAIVLTECWLNENSIIRTLDGYNAFHTTKYINKAGGVTIYVKESHNTIATEPEMDEANGLIVNIGGVLNVIGIYRSPSFSKLNNFLNSLDENLNKLKSNCKTVLIGDLNIDLLADNPSCDNTEYQSLMAHHGLLPAITKPTRENACLDHAFVRCNNPVIGIVAKSTLSDHDAAMIGIDTDESKSIKDTNKSLLKTDFEALQIWSLQIGHLSLVAKT